MNAKISHTEVKVILTIGETGKGVKKSQHRLWYLSLQPNYSLYRIKVLTGFWDFSELSGCFEISSRIRAFERGYLSQFQGFWKIFFILREIAIRKFVHLYWSAKCKGRRTHGLLLTNGYHIFDRIRSNHCQPLDPEWIFSDLGQLSSPCQVWNPYFSCALIVVLCVGYGAVGFVFWKIQEKSGEIDSENLKYCIFWMQFPFKIIERRITVILLRSGNLLFSTKTFELDRGFL